jgi:hypothetical protein
MNFAQASRRLTETAKKIEMERGVSFRQAFKFACEKEVEASLIYFQNPRTRRLYIETPAQIEEKKREDQEAGRRWQAASDKIARLIRERVASGLAKDDSEAIEQVKRAEPDLWQTYVNKGRKAT